MGKCCHLASGITGELMLGFPMSRRIKRRWEWKEKYMKERKMEVNGKKGDRQSVNIVKVIERQVRQ